MKKIFAFLMCILLIFTPLPTSNAEDYLNVSVENPISDISQAEQFLKNRNASEEIYQYLPFIYEYCDEMNVNEVLVITMSSIETGYFKSSLWRNNNNPGGIKSKNGWAKFDTPEDGFKRMINLLATYAGTYNEHSWLYGKAKRIPDLGNYYYVENGCDKGYTRLLISQMKKMMSYEIKTKEKETKKPKTKKVKPKVEKELTPQEYIMSFTKKRKSGLDMIMDAIK